MRKDRPITSDGRYFVARGVLRRCTDPTLSDSERRAGIKKLMQARMAERTVTNEKEALEVRTRILNAKIALGEAGPVWWSDGVPDLSGNHPAETTYKNWWSTLPDVVQQEAEAD